MHNNTSRKGDLGIFIYSGCGWILLIAVFKKANGFKVFFHRCFFLI